MCLNLELNLSMSVVRMLTLCKSSSNENAKEKNKQWPREKHINVQTMYTEKIYTHWSSHQSAFILLYSFFLSFFLSSSCSLLFLYLSLFSCFFLLTSRGSVFLSHRDVREKWKRQRLGPNVSQAPEWLLGQWSVVLMVKVILFHFM